MTNLTVCSLIMCWKGTRNVFHVVGEFRYTSQTVINGICSLAAGSTMVLDDLHLLLQCYMARCLGQQMTFILIAMQDSRYVPATSVRKYRKNRSCSLISSLDGWVAAMAVMCEMC